MDDSRDETRREFLIGVKGWSGAVAAIALAGGIAGEVLEAAPWTNGSWANRSGGGGWVNRYGGGGAWANRGTAWANRGGAWVNGSAWINGSGGWLNHSGGGTWANRSGGGGWVNRYGGGGSWVNRH